MDKYLTTHLTDWNEWIKPTPLAVRLQQRTKIGSIPKGLPELGECLIWTGTVGKNGYGILSIFDNTHKKRKILVHRLAYELIKGSIPEQLVLDHLCRNKLCVNASHLEAVTLRENFRRGNGNSNKAYCPQGHPYDLLNTRYRHGRYGTLRICKLCEASYQRRYDASHREMRNAKQRTKRLAKKLQQ